MHLNWKGGERNCSCGGSVAVRLCACCEFGHTQADLCRANNGELRCGSKVAGGWFWGHCADELEEGEEI